VVIQSCQQTQDKNAPKTKPCDPFQQILRVFCRKEVQGKAADSPTAVKRVEGQKIKKGLCGCADGDPGNLREEQK
jgi:hypothetical protein